MIALLIIAAVFFYSLANISIARASSTGDPNFAAMVVNFLGALSPMALFILAKPTSASDVTNRGTIWAVIGGVSIGLFAITITQLFARGGSQSYIFPLIFGTSIAIITVVGSLFFRERLSLISAGGIVVILLGVLMLAYGNYQMSKGAII